ncbi:Nitric oxide-associated protein 1, partial [Dissostichus eleginoides]
VPAGGSERMKDFPPLVPQDFRLQGVGDQLLLLSPRPRGRLFSLRTPPLLPHLVKLKGDRVRKSVAYRTLKHV